MYFKIYYLHMKYCCYHLFKAISLKIISNKFENKPFLRYDETYELEDEYEDEENKYIDFLIFHSTLEVNKK